MFQFHIACGAQFFICRYCVDIRCGGADRHVVAGHASVVDQLIHQEVNACRAFFFQYGLKSVPPFLCFLRIAIYIFWLLRCHLYSLPKLQRIVCMNRRD